ncbi:hypothetical protein USDA257_c17300 [Sinorhizobium fredii USDA 257]|uniref:Uncharacterized protein n=2 Tax=Rhizobium fredii TaxID=380 RepID=I3X362_SINF2|nr:hypothetical protein USDA257_c17300 [Sinorhizobium fredii USDA 257]
MRFISGAARLRQAHGRTFSCGPGYGVFVPVGADVAWENDTDVLKIACFVS